jgi:hypothetical protein
MQQWMDDDRLRYMSSTAGVNGIAGWSQTGTSEIVTEGTVDFDGESQGMKLRSDSDDHPVLVLRNFHEEEVLLVPVRSCQGEHITLSFKLEGDPAQ